MSAGVEGVREGGAERVDFYDATYARFEAPVYRAIRRETWDEDFGQNGWITAREQDALVWRLGIGPGKRILDVACGSGGPTLRLALRTGATVIGVDIHEAGVATGREQARGLAHTASFEVVDARGGLPFADASFDAVVCIDAINHLADRLRVLCEWRRVLRPDGKLAFTDPVVVTGPLTSEEIGVRASIGHFVFVAPDTNDRLLAEAGLRVESREDATEALAESARRWREARERRAEELTRLEGRATFEGQQRFLETAAKVARERRLSRFAYIASRPGGA